MILNVEKRKRGRPRKIFDGTPKEKKKLGAPKKAKVGSNVWVQAEFLDTIKTMLETLRQQNQQQAKQS
jgi:hypothetical protein